MVFLLIIIIITLYSVYWYYQMVKRYPPGPTPIPFLGNLLQLRPENTHKQIEEIGKKFGPVFTLFIPLPTVIITGLKEHKEALIEKGDNFSSRPDNPSDSVFLNIPNGGIIFSQGKEWEEQRGFTLRTLRSFGVGSQVMEQKILLSVDSLFSYLEKLDLSDIDINWPVHLCVGNVVHEILFGFQTSFEQSENIRYYQYIIDDAMQKVRSRASILVVQALPWTRFLPLIGKWGYWELRGVALELLQYVEQQIEKTQEEINVEEGADNYVAAYLKEMSHRQKTGNLQSFSIGNLVNCATDIWLAGMETAATTIRWAVILLTAHPEVQDCLFEELKFVCGDERVSMSDRSKLLYAQAVVCEIHRVSNVVTFNVFHKNYRDDTIGGHFIPAGSTVLPQITSILSSDEYFEDAHLFNPERFIRREHDGQITLIKKEMDKVVAFSLGKRQCAGEALARMEVFLITLSLVQKYRFECAFDTPNLTPVFGILQTPQPFRWRLVERK